MPQIRLQHVISYTSEDSKYKIENLINGSGVWLCHPGEQSSTIQAEFQLEKASTIDFIDIGNYNTALLSIEVGMSSWLSSQEFVTLLPTIPLMSPSDCRCEKNAKSVRMFMKEHFNKENSTKKWDRLRVICSQPFKKNIQYGLSFIKLCSQSKTNCSQHDFTDGRTESQCLLTSSNSPASTAKPMSKSLQDMEKGRIRCEGSSSLPKGNTNMNITSPLSRSGRLVMAHKHEPNELGKREQKKELELEALTFLISLNLTAKDIHSLKVSHLREEFECRRGKALNTHSKLIFKNIALDYAAKNLEKINSEEGNEMGVVDVEEDYSLDEKKSSTKGGRFAFKRTTPHARSVSSLDDGKWKDSLPRNDRALGDSGSGMASTVRSDAKRRRVSPIGDHFDAESTKVKDTWSLWKHDRNREEPHDPPNDDLSCDFIKNTPNGSSLHLVECPLCNEMFSSNSVEKHAATCDGEPSFSPQQVSRSNFSMMNEQNSEGNCPICSCSIGLSQLKSHAEECAESNFP